VRGGFVVVKMLLVFLLMLVVCMSANAQPIIVEAESYVASHDEGGAAIHVTACGAASGGFAIEGFDFPGDWIEVALVLGDNKSMACRIRSGGDVGVATDLQSTVFGAGTMGEDLVSPYPTQGVGIG
jgi:hypothetical protein